jgi:hypothetical protein
VERIVEQRGESVPAVEGGRRVVQRIDLQRVDTESCRPSSAREWMPNLA